ncbi:MAG TPA: DUF559 domain-containing protein [Solirubrobacteraceae bacterium]|nr:DUF559 domain-containing protein [Solirubrobacteraceae bacterium]
MPGPSRSRPYAGQDLDNPPLERRIMARALAQHAVLAVDEIVDLGLSASAVRSRVAAGRLHAVHAGVVAVVPPALLTWRGRIVAALRACGPMALASYRTAALLLCLGLHARAWIDVTVPSSRGYRRPGIHVHSGATLSDADVTQIDGIPCTTLARTLLDIADDATPRELERAIDHAERRRILDMAAVQDVLERANGRGGAAVLQAVFADHRATSTLTRSGLEEAFLGMARGAGHPPDTVNAWIPYPEGGGAEADFLWRERRLIAEVDGRDVHTTRRAFEHDRRRDQRLTALGWRVVRFSWRQVEHEPDGVVATLRTLLGGSTPPGAPS